VNICSFFIQSYKLLIKCYPNIFQISMLFWHSKITYIQPHAEKEIAYRSRWHFDYLVIDTDVSQNSVHVNTSSSGLRSVSCQVWEKRESHVQCLSHDSEYLFLLSVSLVTCLRWNGIGYSVWTCIPTVNLCQLLQWQIIPVPFMITNVGYQATILDQTKSHFTF